MAAPGWRRLLVGLLFAAACGCSRVETTRPVPWFKVRTQHSPAIGGFSGSSTGLPPQVRHYGLLWKELEGCLGGEALDPETVAVFCSDTFHSGIALVRRGQTTPRPACGDYASYSQIVPDRSGVDCSTMLAGKAPVVPTSIRYFRVTPALALARDTTLTIAEPGRALVGPAPRFYDDRMEPYFVVATEDWKTPPDCALMTVEGGTLALVEAAPDMPRRDCSDAALWSKRTGRRLRTPSP